MPYTYILKSIKQDNWHYVGSCNDLDERFKQHRKGSVRSTKSKRPLKIIYKEFYKTITEARKRKLFLKSPKGFLEKKKITNKPE
ncbi:GIY-YIG nuclease family protein [Candidatus Falkowbacteria bacterium]|nr:GIY-YIG nuclease family protein [Candidatus Falkowbacteria bacterium]